jgi:brefeldin A-resistance guanine nucleotide exchange factor 1
MVNERYHKSPTPSAVMPVFRLAGGIQSTMSLNSEVEVFAQVAIDPITLMINECITMSSAMRKMARWSQSGVAAILGAGDLFGTNDEDALTNNLGLSSNVSLNRNSKQQQDNPLTSSFLQLKSILTDATDLYELDSLTLLQPFLMVIRTSSTPGNITSLALDSISKFLNYEILSPKSKNLKSTLIQIISSLAHCRFEAADQDSDDAVLLKVIRLLEIILQSPLSNLLPNESISEVVQNCLSLACNKKRSEVLRKAAEMAMLSITYRIFSRLHDIEPESETIDDIQTTLEDTKLPEDKIGGTEETDQSEAESKNDVDVAGNNDVKLPQRKHSVEVQHSVPSDEEPFGIVCIVDFMRILVSIVAPSNQYQHMESTRVFALSLITTAIQVSGKEIPLHPSLFSLVSDPISKHTLQIITTTESPALLHAALQLFSTLAIVLGRHLNAQIELSLTLIFQSVFPESRKNRTDIIESKNITNRTAVAKEILVESLSLLWTRSPRFFTELFIDYDCDFDKSDLATKVLEYLCKLALPESALITTDNVPPICLEGILSLISAIHDRIKRVKTDPFEQPVHNLIKNRNHKTAFIKCTEILNENPKKGVQALQENGFIKDSSDINEVANFFFSKSGRLNKKLLGEYLAKPSNTELLKKFIDLFDFAGLRVDEAIRLLLKAFRLPGESQQIERIVELFAEKYVSGQPPVNEEDPEEVVTPDRDSVFVLSYSIIMLNTDLHNPQVKQQMLLEDYKRNLRGVYNGKDFPEWYLAKIYNSIKDREIIMPEEHHGTDKWFDDVWHNLVSTQSNLNEEHQEFSSTQIRQFDKELFEATVDKMIDTLVSVFKEASDDHIITKIMSSIDKCANVCLYYNLSSPIDKLVGALSDLTALDNKSFRTVVREDNQRDEIPITQLKIEGKDEPITVSETAVWFGRDFKAQLSTVVLVRLLKKIQCTISPNWNKVVKIILTLFENCLVNPNLFSEFQKKLKLTPLAKVKPRYIINKVKPVNNSGILSTFSSFLKGYSDEPPEPSESEIESTLSTMDCIKSVNIPPLFEVISKSDPANLKGFIELLLTMLPEHSDTTKRYYESETLFLFEILVCFTLLLGELSTTTAVLAKLSSMENISKKGQLRMLAYRFLLIRQGDNTADVSGALTSCLAFDKDIVMKNGAFLVQPVLSLTDEDSWCCQELLLNEDYWKLLRLFGSILTFSSDVLQYMEGILANSTDIVPENYMFFLGLLDEVSSLGALGSPYEQDKESKKDQTENKNYKEIVEIAKKSVSLTAQLSPVTKREEFCGKELSYSLIQALAHQCFNPCREVRVHSMKKLKSIILSTEINNGVSAFGLFDFGLFPLLVELSKPEVIQTDNDGFVSTQIEALALVSKVFLQYYSHFQNNEVDQVWLGILDNFQIFKELAANSQHTKVFDESAPELLKNMFLVLQQSREHHSNRDLWNPTWERIEVIYPQLKVELATIPAQPEGTESGSVESETKEAQPPQCEEDSTQVDGTDLPQEDSTSDTKTETNNTDCTKNDQPQETTTNEQ